MKRAALALLVCLPGLLPAQPADPLSSARFRLIGPYRGGRVVAVAGVNSQPNTYYFGAVGGGVWKTTDSGLSWANVSDGFFKTASVGAVAVADSDPNTVYVGMGEACVRGNVSNGDGVYKSIDAGRTWKNVGLQDSYHIGAVRVHPRNPDIVYVAALGHLFGPNDTRGVYRSTDGGATWKQVLTRNRDTGAVDLVLDPSNPRVIYAGFWQVRRQPHHFDSGGPGSGLFKSTDGGDTWTEISRAPGLPRGVLGRIGVTVSPANPDRVWALIEAADGGVFRSDNAGRTWTRINQDPNLRQRAWYYTHIIADPQSADTVYALNVGMFKSIDGGRSWTPIGTPHSDNHSLWIAPDDPLRMVQGNDGGANVSRDGGRTWSSIMNQPTAQFYRVTVDNDFPYNIYGAQQDNSTIRIASRTSGAGITERDWYDVGGGESGWIAPDPRDSRIVYAGSYDGLLTRQDARTGQTRNITAWPDNPMGYGVEVMKYRFQWNYPILFSPHDPKTLYIGGNVVMKTTNEGQSWQVISPDLTRNDKSRMGTSGGPITQDNTSVEYYCTVFTMMESTLTKGLIWAGSDDGLVHLTRDAGKAWVNVTPKDMPEWIQINSIDASPHDPATAYFAGTMYKSDDFRPYLYKTNDYGKTWKKIVNGIPDNVFTRVIREDPNRKGLLVAGTEFGLYISYDDGENWKPFQYGLPVTSITDAIFHKRDKELVVATQGRSFYVFDDLPLVHQLNGATVSEDVRLFKPKDVYRFGAGGRGGGGGGRGGSTVGENPAGGAVVQYALKSAPKELKLEFLDSAGKVVNTFSNQGSAVEESAPGPAAGPVRAPAAAGMNRFVWNLRYPDATGFPGLIMWAASLTGPRVAPGTYQVRLTVDGKAETQSFAVMKDPRLTTTSEDYAKQVSLALQIRDKVSEANDGVVRIRAARAQLEPYAKREDKRIADAASALLKKLTAVEEELYQTKLRSGQDPLNYGIKLNNKLAAVLGVVNSSDDPPTQQSYMVYEELASKANAQLKILSGLLTGDLAAFNKLVHDANVPAVQLAK